MSRQDRPVLAGAKFPVEADKAFCPGRPVMMTPMARRSSGESQAMSDGRVAMIRPTMRGGTPSSLAMRAIDTVAASACAV